MEREGRMTGGGEGNAPLLKYSAYHQTSKKKFGPLKKFSGSARQRTIVIIAADEITSQLTKTLNVIIIERRTLYTAEVAAMQLSQNC